MTSLAQNLQEFANIMRQIEENNGEISNDILPVLSKAELSLSEKVDSYVNFHEVVQGQIERTKKTIENFKKNLQTLENLENRLKSNVKMLMEGHDLIKIDGNERSIKLMNAGGVQPTHKPDDMFYQLECVEPKYRHELAEFIQEGLVYLIKDKDKFKEAIKDNKIKSCFLLPRSKYVKFI